MKATHIAITNLLGNPHLTRAQIAELTGTSVPTVDRVSARIRKALPKDRELEVYQKLVRKRLPHEKAVDVLEMSMKDVRFALPALKYRDELLGLAPKRPESSDSAPQGPTIMFPPGTRIDIGIRATAPSGTTGSGAMPQEQRIIDLETAQGESR